MMCITVEQATSLATRYGAFRATDMSNYREISLWGGLLLEIQRETGVEMYDNDWLEKVIEYSDSRYHAKAA